MKFVKKRRRILVPHVNSGRHVDFIGFLLCFMSVLLLTCGLILILISIWSIVRKWPYYILFNIKVDVPYFALTAGILSCSSFWIAASLHNNWENYRFLCLLILLLSASLMMIITGVSMGMMKGSIASLGSELSPMNWVDFNTTLEDTFKKYNVEKYKVAWNRIQHQLHCCGLNSKHDWLFFYGVLPNSCCLIKAPCNIQKAFGESCLELIKYDLLWQRNFLVIHCYIVGTLEGIVIIATGSVCYWRKIKGQYN